MTNTGGELLAALANEGVKFVFGCHALRSTRSRGVDANGLRFVTIRHEPQRCRRKASAGRPARLRSCSGPGPGSANLLPG
jgi:hypothetical protein